MSFAAKNNWPQMATQSDNAEQTMLAIARPDVGNKRHDIAYKSREMHELVNKAVSFARSSATVLITGENGTGKELFARLLHDSGSRPSGRYARVNCAALSEHLIESELFGHEKGAFTGADGSRIGRFEWAAGGTLLLDEISEINLRIQAKLLRVLEENEIQRIGSNETIKTNVRVVATSNRDMLEQVRKGEFREDLYYRLNVLRLGLPALRERPQDIPLLANLFLKRYRGESRHAIQGFSKEAMQLLCKYSWPGNVRQLRNSILSACVVAESELIQEKDLACLDQPAITSQIPSWMFQSNLEEIERRLILEHLVRARGNKTAVASVLGVTTRTLTNKINKYRAEGVIPADDQC